MSDPIPPMVPPSPASTVAFVAIVMGVAAMFVLGAHWSTPAGTRRTRRTAGAAGGIAAVLLLSAVIAELGWTRALAGTYAFVAVPVAFNAIALAAALSSLGRDMAQRLPLGTLVSFQAFRLPLELVLHRWFEEGVLPVQMTYAGHNFDIVTGVLALVFGLGLGLGKLPRWTAWLFNLVGFGLLIAVVRIAILSSPVPMRTYLEEPTVQLAFHAPYIWIISICVSGALFGHVVTFRALMQRPSKARSG